VPAKAHERELIKLHPIWAKPPIIGQTPVERISR
jgi:hypothetical protein